MPDDSVTITEDAARHRFEIAVDGTVAGFIDYHDRGNRRSILHTDIDSSYEGKGLGGKLARHVLDDARAHGLDVLPHCPFVRSYIANHRDYVDLVPEADRPQFGLDG